MVQINAFYTGWLHGHENTVLLSHYVLLLSTLFLGSVCTITTSYICVTLNQQFSFLAKRVDFLYEVIVFKTKNKQTYIEADKVVGSYHCNFPIKKQKRGIYSCD